MEQFQCPCCGHVVEQHATFGCGLDNCDCGLSQRRAYAIATSRRAMQLSPLWPGNGPDVGIDERC